MIEKKKLAHAIGALAGVMAMAGVTSPAYAQQPGATVEEMVVTGSRIRRADLESASPVTVIDRSVIIDAGLTDVGNLVQRMPSMSGSPIGTTTNNGGNGAVQIDLRGLGVDRTLTLVNGQRTVDRGDYQTIPAVMIERVEVLKDGASAVYGADAVAGVVNIITRSNFEGFEVNAQVNDWDKTKGAEQRSLDFIAGKNFDGGNFVFGAEYVKQEEAYQGDTPWAFFQDAYYIYPEGCEAHPTLPYDGTPNGGCYPLGSSFIPESRLTLADGDQYMAAGGVLQPYDGRTYNYAPVNLIQTPYERLNLFIGGDYDLTDRITFNGQVRANFRDSAQELAPQPYGSLTDPGYSGTWLGEAYNGISPDNYYLTRAFQAAGLTPQPVVDARRRMEETPRRFEQEITQYQGIFGVSGVLENDIEWDVTYNTGYRSRNDTDFGQFFGPYLTNAMGPSADLNGDGVPECYSNINEPSTLIQGCVPFNFFGGPLSVTPEMLDYVGVVLNDSYHERMDTLNIAFNGSAFELPGGALGWAAGAGWWDQQYKYTPDSGKAAGQVTGNKGAGTNGAIESVNAFAEVFAPVYDNGVQSVNLKAGIRYDDFDAFGSDETWQLGVEFAATNDIKLRATRGTVFRAPQVDDLYEGIVDSFVTYTDPCIPAAGAALPSQCAQVGVQTDSQVRSRMGGNPNLQPETGDTWTAGVVWTPDVPEGNVSFTLDYWDIKIQDGISSLGVQYILEDCYLRNNTGSCGLIQRRNDYSIASILDTQLNVADQGAKGVDFEARYSFETAIGSFDTSLLWAHLIERTKVPYAGAAKIDLSGRYTDPTAEDGGAYAQDKINLSIQWANGPLSISYLNQYISSIDADTFCNCGPVAPYIQKVDSFMYHDLMGRYEFESGTAVSLGVTNLTNEAPPFIEVGFNATTDPSTYRMLGRGVWLRLQQTF
jgi:iron complex outermembrane receptor protein